ncbi:hypothetical protein [Cellulomonas soli]
MTSAKEPWPAGAPRSAHPTCLRLASFRMVESAAAAVATAPATVNGSCATTGPSLLDEPRPGIDLSEEPPGFRLKPFRAQRAAVPLLPPPHRPAHGPNLANGRSWSKGTRVDIPKTQTYGAHFSVGTVKVTVGNQSGTCSTIGPRVDDLMLYKS